MPGQFDDILKKGECIAEEVMLNYLEGKLSPPDQHAVEKHLLGCEFCSEAMEGLSMQHAQNNRASLDKLESAINRRISEDMRKPGARFWYSMAAILALTGLFGGGYYYLQSLKKSETVFSENFSPYHDTVSESPVQQTFSTNETPLVNEKKKEAARKEPKVSENKQAIVTSKTVSGSSATYDSVLAPLPYSTAENAGK